MLRSALRAALIGITLVAARLPLSAATDWPREVRIGPEPRFHIVDIKPEGETSATGTVVDLPGFQPFRISLTRAASGDIAGTGKGSIVGLGLKMDVEYRIATSGLEAKGTISGPAKASARPITSAVFTLLPQGTINGKGIVEVGGYVIPCRFKSEGPNLRFLDGSVAIDPVRRETALASYTFKGSLALRFLPDKAISVNAVGVVERLGKLTSIADTYGGYDEPINVATGEVKLNVAGVDVVFKLW